MSTFEKRFRKRLIDKETTQKNVADHFGWTPQYVRQLIKGLTTGPAANDNLQKVKDYLEMK